MYVWTEYLVQRMLTAITINLSPVLCETNAPDQPFTLGVWDEFGTIIDLFPQLHWFCLYFCEKNKINEIIIYLSY